MQIILEFIKDIFDNVLDWIFETFSNLFLNAPTNSLPFPESLVQIMTTGYQFSFIIPWRELFVAVSFILSWHISLFIIKFVKWVIEVIPKKPL